MVMNLYHCALLGDLTETKVKVISGIEIEMMELKMGTITIADIPGYFSQR